ncbi:hypothetical protein D3C75_532480 [compost metagenome]
MATPINGVRISGIKYKLRRKFKEEPNSSINIGSIVLQNDQTINIQIPQFTSSVNYNVNLMPHLSIRGLNIPSHRTPYSYRKISSIPVRAHTNKEAFETFNNTLRQRFSGQYHGETPGYHMKASIISLAVFGSGNDFVQADEKAFDLFNGFIDILKKLLPPTLGFKTLGIVDGEVILQTASGDFLLDSVSGGIGAIFDLAWQIYMFSSGEESPFFILIDEAENHLHASMQRQLLPNLLSSFPNAQFIVTTHSPLMVNSVKDSSVYVLKYNKNNAVESHLLDFDNKAAGAAEILREVLGVPVTMPIWVEKSLENIIIKYQSQGLNVESYQSLKSDLAELGLADHLPQALGMLQGGEPS